MLASRKRGKRTRPATRARSVARKPKHVLVLRTCRADMTSSGGFVWPKKGWVECPDWKPTRECDHGLHGWLWGEGDGLHGEWGEHARWLVVRVRADEIVDLGGKVKFPRGFVVFCGDRIGATSYIASHGGAGRAIIGAVVTGRARATVRGGYRSIVTGGVGATVSGGVGATLILRRRDGRVVMTRVGDNGIEPHKKYKLDYDGKFVPAEQEAK